MLLTLSQTSPGFYVSAYKPLKTLWEKEKLLVTSNFSFSHNVYYPLGEHSAIFIRLEIVICKVWKSLKFVVWERVKLALKNVTKLAKGSLNNIFQDSFNKILFQQ